MNSASRIAKSTMDSQTVQIFCAQMQPEEVTKTHCDNMIQEVIELIDGTYGEVNKRSLWMFVPRAPAQYKIQM